MTSLDVLPRLAFDDGVDVGLAESIFISDELEICALDSLVTDVADVILNKLAAATNLAYMRCFDLVEMLPGTASDCVSKDCDFDIMTLGDLPLGFSSLGSPASVKHDLIGEDRRGIQLSSLLSGRREFVLDTSNSSSPEVHSIAGISTSSLPVGHVRCVITVEMMSRSTAWWIIAGMTDVVRNLSTIGQDVGHAVSSDRSILLFLVAVTCEPEEAILLALDWATGSSPFPTRVLVIDYVDLGPEAHLQCGQRERTCLEQVRFALSDLRSKILEVSPYLGDFRLQLSDRFPAFVPFGEGPYFAIIFSHDGSIAGVEASEMGVSEPTHFDLYKINFSEVSPAQEVV
jgi:hypothetical protein